MDFEPFKLSIMIGREKEAVALAKFLNDYKRGVCHIYGPSGSGKTSLVQAVVSKRVEIPVLQLNGMNITQRLESFNLHNEQ